MPPRFRFTRERIVDAAFSIARTQGMGAVTARIVAQELGSSSKVIFGLFRDMEELNGEVKDRARALYMDYIERGLKNDIPFKGVGEQYIRFAKEEPKLFGLLFMSEEASMPTLADVLDHIDSSYEKILSSIERSYGLSRDNSKQLYQTLWIYSHGIAVLFATKLCAISDEEVSRMLSDVFRGIIINYKTEEKK